MLFLIVGKSASGKDTLAQELTNRGLSQVISRTDRDARYDGEDTHIFVSKDLAKQEYEQAIAKTEISGNKYYALAEDIEDKDVYIIDPKGLKDLCHNCPDTTFHVIYVYANENNRRTHAIARATNKEEAANLFDARQVDEAMVFDEFKSICSDTPSQLPKNVVAVTVMENDYQPITMYNMAEQLMQYKRKLDGVKNMVIELSAYNIFDIDDDMMFKAFIDGEETRLPLEQICSIFLADDKQLAELTRSYLSLNN